ncbi:site-2 protease family protein [Phormidesmis priestleyi]|uniref:site-2 protease family protein n=1 Tax=Phormidesmis priestleyi TaxID=268141 RepID=UPI00083ABF6E|nr:site-2 protease family protein [Phormidesmis priestleyi]
MQSSWRAGSLFGIPLLIDPSWFFVLALITLSDGSVFQQNHPEWGTTIAWGTGLLMALLLFASVLLHELGHSLVAKIQGIQVKSITLFFFGGVAAIEQEPKTPGKAFQVAIAGPLVSLSLFVLLSLLTVVLPVNSPVEVLTQRLAAINLVLTLFNLIPGLPLDGGLVLKSIVWKITGSHSKGVHWAARSGKTLGGLAIAFGILGVFGRVIPTFTGLYMALIGWFILRNATAYDRLTDLQEVLLNLKADDAMTREFRVVEAKLTLRQFADDYLLSATRAPIYFAASDGRYRGMVEADALQAIERSQWETQTLSSIVKPLSEIPSVQEAASLVDVIYLMETKALPRVTVLSPAGAISGVIDRGDVVRSLSKKMNLPISDAAIKQIKEEGAYPLGLQLGEVAKAAVDFR